MFYLTSPALHGDGGKMVYSLRYVGTTDCCSNVLEMLVNTSATL